MASFIFPDMVAYEAFEARSAAREGVPKSGLNAATREIVDPRRLTEKGWTLRVTDPTLERSGSRVLAQEDESKVSEKDKMRIETRNRELDKFGPLRVEAL